MTKTLICMASFNKLLSMMISGSAIKKMTDKVLHHHEPHEGDHVRSSSTENLPAALSGHQDLDNWV